MNRFMTHDRYAITRAIALIAAVVFGLLPVTGTAQTISTLNLSSSSGGNTNDDDLNVSYSLSGGATTAATAWLRNGSPVQSLYFPFEGASTNALRDFSGSGSTIATTVGATSWNATNGRDGSGAMTFGGADYLLAGSNTFPAHSSYTQSAWIYRTALGALGYGFIVAGQGSTASTHGIRVTSDGRVSAGQNGNYRFVQSYPATINLNTWYFVAVSYDNSTGTMILYRDGQPVDTAVVPTTQRDVTDASSMIGASAGGSNGFIGRIDEVRVFNYVLSKDQVEVLYTGTNRLAASESFVGEIWQAQVIPFSSSAMGSVTLSNAITIVATAPVITSSPITFGIAGKRYTYDVNSTGGPTPTYSLNSAPTGMTINAATGLIYWIPSSPGISAVTVAASNSQGTVTQDFLVTVSAPNVGLANVALSAGPLNDLTASYNLTLNATTAATAWFKNGNPIMIFHLPMEGGTTWALDDVSGNNITCLPIRNPNYMAAGGRDGQGCFEFSGSNYLIAGNIFPTNASYTKCAWIYHTVSGSFTHILSGWVHQAGAGPDGGHGLRVTNDDRLSAGHNGNWRIVNTPTGTIARNTWYFVAVTFDYAASSMQLFINGNRVDSQGVAASLRNMVDPSLLVGSTEGAFGWQGRIDDARVYNYALTRDQISTLYTAGGANKIAASEVQIGEVWQARVMPYSATEAGIMYATNPVTIGVSNQFPILAAIGPKAVDENQTLAFSVSASDPELAVPILSAAPLPANATFVDNGNGTGSFTFNPSYTQAGTYNVTFSASDGTQSVSEIVVITVNNINRPPVMAAIVPQMILEGVALNLLVSASDPDAEALTLNAAGLPANAIFADNGNGTGSFAFTPAVGQAGIYNVKFRVFDPSVAGDSVTVAITVVSTLPPADWAATIHVEGEVVGSSSHSAEVIIGTAGSDMTTAAAPFPPEYTTVAQLWRAGVEGPYYRDLRQSGAQCYYWVIEVDPHGNVAPAGTSRCATISWNPAQLSSSRNYVLVEGSGPNGAPVVADMRTINSYQVCDLQTPRYFTVQWYDEACAGKTFVNMAMAAGWNLISLPVIPESPQLSLMFPTAEAAFGFNAGYQEATLLSSGAGYWVKMPSSTTITLFGTPVTDASGALNAGWNLVGAPNCSVAPTTTPSDNIEAVFGFNGAYFPATQLEAGAGYWIKATSNSTLNAACGAPAPSNSFAPVAAASQATGVVTIHAEGATVDGASRADIVLGVSDRTMKLSEPPSVPQYSVALAIYDADSRERLYKDVRGDASIANHWAIAINPRGNTGEQSIASAILSWNTSEFENAGFEIREGMGTEGSVVVSDMSKESQLRVTGTNEEIYFTVLRSASGGNLPAGFALNQNYPNPFNPSTQIGFSLPQASHVRLDIYNVLGQQVKSLIDQTFEAGQHLVTWDATDNAGHSVSSGVYFYRLSSPEFSERKKMLLLR